MVHFRMLPARLPEHIGIRKSHYRTWSCAVVAPHVVLVAAYSTSPASKIVKSIGRKHESISDPIGTPEVMAICCVSLVCSLRMGHVQTARDDCSPWILQADEMPAQEAPRGADWPARSEFLQASRPSTGKRPTLLLLESSRFRQDILDFARQEQPGLNLGMGMALL
ncbi:hypothetical protein BC567DRAFT_233998, partial [Phyllosticta citribraziliensis]